MPTVADDIAEMIAALAAEGERAPRAALKRLMLIGEAAFPALLTAAQQSPDLRIRRWALEGIAEFGDRRVRRILLSALTE
jgi:HEAT repeat protein